LVADTDGKAATRTDFHVASALQEDAAIYRDEAFPLIRTRCCGPNDEGRNAGPTEQGYPPNVTSTHELASYSLRHAVPDRGTTISPPYLKTLAMP
jgi:hypothetical protein